MALMKNNQILLIRPNYSQDKKDTYITFPLGLGYISAVLKENGWKVSVIDLTLEDVDYYDLGSRIKKYDPGIVGISALSFAYRQVKILSAFLKKTISSKIILGGHLAIHNHNLVLKNSDVDICVMGEGELTIVDLLNNLSNLEKVKGIAYKENGKVVLNEPRELVKDLNTIPFPAYELFDIDKYSEFSVSDIFVSRKNLPKSRVHRKMIIEAARGCAWKCDFCSKMYDAIRKRSVEKVIEEIVYLKEKHNIDIFGFQDELLFSSKRFMLEFCEKVKDLGVVWSGCARVDTVDRETIELVSKSNCIYITYGVESGSTKVLKKMNKKITPARIEQTLRDTIEVGLPMTLSFILGYPGEDRESVQDTLNLLKRVGHPGVRFRYITPYPGSAIYDSCIKDGLIPNEEKYLESLGDGTGPYRFRFNFTSFSDEELVQLLPDTINRAYINYIFYLLKHPKYFFRYLSNKDYMNPVYYFYSRWKNPTNYDKAAKKKIT